MDLSHAAMHERMCTGDSMQLADCGVKTINTFTSLFNNNQINSESAENVIETYRFLYLTMDDYLKA